MGNGLIILTPARRKFLYCCCIIILSDNVGSKKLAKRIGHEVGAEIRKGNEDIIRELRREINSMSQNTERSKPRVTRTHDKEMQKRRETVSYMIGVLSEHQFGVGKEAQTLKDVELKLLERMPITQDDTIAVFKIMQVHARSDAEQMEMNGTAPIF